MKKQMSIFLVILMLLGCLAGCKTPEKEPDTTKGETTEESEETRPPEIGDSGLPAALDFGYEKVKILHRTRFKNELYAEEEDEGTVEQAIWSRNEFVQEKLKVAFDYVEINEAYNQYAKMHDRILTSYNTGDGDVQIISGGAYYAPVLITQNVYYDLHSLNESKANYLDFEKVWWNSAFAEQAEISGKLYYATGDLTVSVTKEVEATVYNKDLFDNYFTDVDLLQVVYDGEWTYAKMLSYLAEVGNGDENGVWGLCMMNDSGSIDGLLSGMEVDLMKQENDSLVVDINTDHNIEVVNTLRTLYHNNSNVSAVNDANSLFRSGKSVFFTGMVLKDNGVLANGGGLDFAFYVIPNPKWDDKQEEYVVAPHDLYSCISVLNGVKDTDMISAVLELLSYGSYTYVRPALFEKTYKYSYIGTSDGAKMFDYVLDHISYNFMNIYSNVLGDVFWTLRDNVRYLKKNQLLTDLANAESKAKANLETFLYAVEQGGAQ